jgi:hypothetical protein
MSQNNLNDCGCCQGLARHTPVEIINCPGLAAIAYRVGTHSQFKQSMLTSLSDADKPILQDLKTREDDDFSIALLDAWATVADVLTFYQERIANESYLRTATERFSLAQLANLIGYKLRPGVAASTYLAFTIESAQGAPKQATIDIGVKVQTLPGPGELPQIFETIETVEARADWNTLKPQTRILKKPITGDTTVYLQGTATGLKPGDGLLFVGFERVKDSNNEQWDFRLVTAVTPDPITGTSLVAFDRPIGSTSFGPSTDPQVYALRKRAALFGANAPDPRTLPSSLLTNYQNYINTTSPGDWKFALNNLVDLDASYPAVTRLSWIVLSHNTYRKLYKADSVTEASTPTNYTLTTRRTQVKPDTTNNLDQFAGDLRSVVAFIQSEQLDLAPRPVDHPYLQGNTIILDSVVAGLEQGRTLIVSGQRIRIKIFNTLVFVPDDGSQSTSLHFGDVLEVLEAPAQVPGNLLKWHLRDKMGVDGLVTVPTTDIDPQRDYYPAAVDDEVVSEAVTIKDPPTDDGVNTTIDLVGSLQNIYDLSTVIIYGNVVRATHGESVQEEVLGNGDGSQSYQSFTLRQSPLTYTSASTASGATSILSVRVNNIEWHEVPGLYGSGPRDRIFVTNSDDSGKVTVQFGDGRTGARLPTGLQNIRATYRKGIGLAGLAKAGQLSLLMTRPLGVKSVLNPQAASGAADSESLADARSNASLTILTLDRIVSLQDYENFARAFIGIAKALATPIRSGQVRGVFVTVAGPNGADIQKDSDLYKYLVDAMQNAGDPYIPLSIESYNKAFFKIAARVKLDPDFDQKIVLPAVEQTLRSTYSFNARSFGQPVTLSEVIAVMQAVPGVIAVEVYKFYRADTGTPATGFPPAQLTAFSPAGSSGTAATVSPAELLILYSGPLDDLGIIP